MAKVRVLLVDDEEFNRTYLRFCLEPAGFEVEEAADGAAAWAVLQGRPDDFDAILLDWRMPQMDGMEVLAKIKADERLAPIPVIMQTAVVRDDDVAEAINAGVYYYLTKPYDSDVLLSVVRAATAEHAQRRRLAGELAKRTGAIRLMTEGRFRLRTPREADALAVMLAGGLPRSAAVAMGLSELLVNAIEHGNLELDYAHKSELAAAGRWDEVIAERLETPPYRDRWVTVEVVRGKRTTRFTISDEGNGFDWQDYENIKAERLFHTHGRGIAMARKLAFSSLRYLGRGNIVEAAALNDGAAAAGGGDNRPLVVARGTAATATIMTRLSGVPGLRALADGEGQPAAVVLSTRTPAVSGRPATLLVSEGAGAAGRPLFGDGAAFDLPADPDLVEAAVRALVLPDSLDCGTDTERRLAPAVARHLATRPPDPASLAGDGILLFEHCRSCSGASGDTWGGRRLADERLFLFIADMAGHGTVPAINCLRLHYMVGADGAALDNPAALLGHIADTLYRRLPAADYAAMAVGLLDPADGTFTYAAAGVPDPLVVTADGCVAGSGRGLPAGAANGFVYATRSLTIPKGGSMVLFTDGLLDILPAGEDVPARRLITTLGDGTLAPTVAGRIAALVERAPDPCPDDLTVLCVTRAD